MIAGLLAETWMADTLLTADISIYPSCNVVDVLDTLAAAPCNQPARLDAISTPHAICFDTYGVMLFAIEASGWDLLPQAVYMLTAAVSLHAPKFPPSPQWAKLTWLATSTANAAKMARLHKQRLRQSSGMYAAWHELAADIPSGPAGNTNIIGVMS